jgi:hypothetical protein
MMRFFLCLLACLVLCIVGCESPTTVAVVVQTDEMTMQVQNIVPTIPLKRPDGKMTTLAQAAAPFYLITFTEAPANQPDYIPPDVQKIAKGLWLESVSVVQFTEPPEGQSFPQDALSLCPPRKDNLILVLDPKRLARNMFHNPAAGTLLLVDRHGYIVDVASVSHPKDLLFKTFQLAQEWDQKEWDESFCLDSPEY